MNLLTHTPSRFIPSSILIFALTLSGCGGGGGSTSPDTTPTSTVSSISGTPLSSNANSVNSVSSIKSSSSKQATSSSSTAAKNLKYSITSGVAIVQLDGTIVTWGEHNQNENTNHTTTHRPPYFSTLFQNIADFKPGVALKHDGKILVWGWLSQIKDPRAKDFNIPFEMPEMSEVVAIASDNTSYWALKADGSVYVWGNNYEGRLGDGTDTERLSPVIAPKLTNIKSIHPFYAVRKDGSVLTWGTNARSHEPIEVPGLTDIIAVSGPRGMVLALKSDGTVYQREEDRTGFDPIVFKKVTELKDIVQISANTHALALDAKGDVFSWGYNGTGALGNGTDIYSYTPQKIQDLSGVVSIAAVEQGSYAVKADGTAYSWGARSYGVIDRANYQWDYQPVKMPSPRHLQYITEFKASGNNLIQGQTAELSAVSSSGLPITYRVAEEGWCNVTGSIVTIHGSLAGRCKVAAMQEGSDDFVPADTAIISINVLAKNSSGNGLKGTWCTDINGDQNCWVFDSETGSTTGKFYQQSINQYSGTLTNTMTWSVNSSAKTLTYRFTWSALSNSPHDYSQAVNVGPFTFPFSINGGVLNFQNINYFKK